MTRLSRKCLGYKAHASIALVLCLLVSYFFLLDNVILLCLLSVFYSLLPDIDTFKSRIGRFFLIFSLVFMIFEPLISLILVILLLIRHRGITHTYIGGFLFSAPMLYFGAEFAAIAFLSYASHLIADQLPTEL